MCSLSLHIEEDFDAKTKYKEKTKLSLFSLPTQVFSVCKGKTAGIRSRVHLQ